MKRLLNAFLPADRSGRLFPFKSSVLVALSGGPDSVALALLLKTLRGPRSLRLAAAHVDHGLRGAVSSADVRWVRRFCAREGIPLHVLGVDVKRRARAEKESVEEAARRARYAALVALAKREKFGVLATAHTADDQAETVLMRLASGSGLAGLAAIPQARAQEGVRIVRPFLGISKNDLLAALKRAGASYRTDRSNASSRFLRNRIRGKVLPLLSRELNPRVAEHLADLAADAGEWRAWAEGEAARFLDGSVRFRPREACLPLKRLDALPRPLRVPVYFGIACRLTGREQHLRREHVRQVEALAGDAGKGEVRLAAGLRVLRDGSGTSAALVWRVRPR